MQCPAMIKIHSRIDNMLWKRYRKLTKMADEISGMDGDSIEIKNQFRAEAHVYMLIINEISKMFETEENNNENKRNPNVEKS